MQLTELLPRLNNPIPYKGRQDDYFSFCPCHDDGAKSGRRSLRTQQKDGKILLYCFAGCTPENIVKALGLTMSDLFTDDKPKASRRQIAAVYDYQDEAGRLSYQVVKYIPKDFRVRRPDGAGGWAWNLKGIDPLPYRLPSLKAALEAGKAVFIVEGEKDADNLAGLGLTATCNHGGAGKWREHHSKHFPAGAQVVILPDNDQPGRDHAEQVKAQLAARGCNVKVLNLPGLPDKGDVSDWIAAGGTREALIKLVLAPPQTDRKFGYSAHELVEMEFTEPDWIVPGRITVGATLFAGPPKLGKSWYCLGLGISWAGKFKILYLALEDRPRRLQKRLRIVLNGQPAPKNFLISTTWPKLDEGGLQQLELFLEQNPDCKLIMVDTLAKVRHKRNKNAGLYEDDYLALTGLKSFADKHGIAVMAVHHVNKSKPADILETVSGTTGLTGAADTIMILGRERGQADGTLFITGRDIEEQDLAMTFDKACCTWFEMGSAKDYRISCERQVIIDAIKAAGGTATPKEIAELTGKKVNAVKQHLLKLVDDGDISRTKHGIYTLNNNSFNTNYTNDNNFTNYTNDDNDGAATEKVSGKLVGKLVGDNSGGQQGQGLQGKVSKVSEVSENDDHGDAWEPDETVITLSLDEIPF